MKIQLPENAKIATFAPQEIGDTIMATALYRALRSLYPKATITLLSEVLPHPVLAGFEFCFDNYKLYDSKDDLDMQYDLIVLPVFCGDDDVYMHFNRFKKTVSLKDLTKLNEKHGLFSQFLWDKHQVEWNVSLAKYLGASISLEDRLYCSQGDPEKFSKYKGHIGLFVSNPLKRNTPNRIWPDEHWKTLISKLNSKPFILIGGPTDRRVKALAEECRVPYLITPTIADFTALCKNLDLIVAGDGGAMHAAATTGVSIIALFGKISLISLHPWIYSPQKCVVIASPNVCSPCDRTYSLRAAERGLFPMTCMQNITPDQVLNALDKIQNLKPGTVMILRNGKLLTKSQYRGDKVRYIKWLWTQFYARCRLRFDDLWR